MSSGRCVLLLRADRKPRMWQKPSSLQLDRQLPDNVTVEILHIVVENLLRQLRQLRRELHAAGVQHVDVLWPQKRWGFTEFALRL